MIIGTLTTNGQSKIRAYLHNYVAHDLYIGYGLGTISDTALETDTGLVAQRGNRQLATATVSGDELSITMSKTVTTSHEVLEVGVFTALTGGVMIYRGLFSDDSTTPKSRWLNSGDTLTVTIVFDFESGSF